MTTYGTDYQYYNIRIYNDPDISGNKPIIAKFSETRVTPILDKPNEYELSIVRFEVPTNTIPILIWPGDDYFRITLEWRGVQKSKFLEFSGQGLKLYGRAIYHYQEVCDIVNKAFSELFNELAVEFPGPLPAPDWALYAYKPPIFVYSQAFKQFQFIIPFTTPDYSTPPDGQDEHEHWSSVIPPVDPLNEIKIYFNRNFDTIITAFQVIGNTDNPNNIDFFRLVVQDTRNNIIQTDITDPLTKVYTMNQSYSNLAVINDFENLIFRSSQIPIVNEFLGTQKNVTRQILTDFIPTPDSYDASKLVFYPQGPLRYYPLITNAEFRNTDLQLFWTNKAGLEFPLYLLPNRQITVKIQFRKKPALVLEDTLYAQNQLN